MAEEILGGFFAQLGLKVDKASFDKGIQAVQSFGHAAADITKKMGLTTGAAAALAKITGVTETASLKSARAIGISTRSLDNWKISAGIAGTSAGALVSSMTQLEKKMQGLKTGQVDTGLAKNLAMLNIGYGDFAKMNATDRMRSVFSSANGMKDQQKAALLVGNVLGQAGRDYYEYMRLSGRTLDDMLAEGRALNFQTESSKRAAMVFNGEFNALAGGVKSMGLFLGGNLGQALTPAVTEIKNIIEANKEFIQSGIIGFAQNLGAAVSGLVGMVEKIAPLIAGLINRFGALDKIIVKVGIGIAGLHLAKLAGGIAGIVQSVGLLKGGLMGLAGAGALGALYLIFDDIMHYFGGGRSILGVIMNHLPDLKEKFKDVLPEEAIEGFKNFAAAIERLIKSIAGSDDFKNGFKEIVGALGDWALTSITTMVKVLGDLADILASLIDGDYSKAGAGLKKMFKDWGEGMAELFKFSEVKEAFSGTYSEAIGGGANKFSAAMLGANVAAREVPGYGQILHAQDWAALKSGFMSKEEYEYYWGENGKVKANKSIKDGIIRPDGQVTQVAPDDWVLAARNIGDIAAAFTPAGVTNNSMNAPASYVINQNFTINGARDISQSVRQQAYSGASDAVLQGMRNSQRLVQLMPGTR